MSTNRSGVVERVGDLSSRAELLRTVAWKSGRFCPAFLDYIQNGKVLCPTAFRDV